VGAECQFKTTEGIDVLKPLIRLLSAGLVVFASLLSTAAFAQIEESPIAFSEQETKRLLDMMNKPVDPGSLNNTKNTLWGEKSMAARLLGEHELEEKFLREWLLISGDSKPKWSLRELLWQKGQRQEAYQLGDELMREVTWPWGAVSLRVQLAFYHMQDGNYAKAQELLNAAGKIIRNEFGQVQRRGQIPYFLAESEMSYFMMRSELESRQGKWTQAIESAKLGATKSKDVLRMLNWVTNEDSKARGREILLMVQTRLAMQQSDAGLYSDAEWTFRELFKLAKEYGFSEAVMPRFYNRLIDLYNASGQFTEARLYSQKTEKTLMNLKLGQDSVAGLNAQAKANTALAGLDEWVELAKRFDAADARITNDGKTMRPQTQAELRGMTFLKLQRAPEALSTLEPELERRIQNFGETHFYTALTRGLLAQALMQNGRKKEAREAYTKSIQHLTAPESISGDFVETAIQRKTKRFILQGFMQLLAESAAASPEDAKTLFSIADQISTSTVQQALTEAAVRAGVNFPGLSDIIRKEQDARNEISSITAYVTNQNSEVAEKRNPQVVAQMRERKRALELERKEYKIQIQKQYPEYFQLIQPKSPSHTDIARQLKSDELFISILPMDDKTYVWAIDAEASLHFHNAPLSEKDVHGLVTHIRKTLDVAELGTRAPAFDFADSHLLYKALIAPLEAQLQGKRHLIIATSGALAQLPLAVLTRSPNAPNAAKDGAWLINDFAISHVPTANGWLSLKKLGAQPSSTQPLMAWGDPLFDFKSQKLAIAPNGAVVRSTVGLRAVDATKRSVMETDTYVTYSKLPSLPETRDEVLELAKIMSANPAKDVILGAQATRQSVLSSSNSGVLGNKKVVVFATHGLLAGDLPNLNQPALAMAGNSNPNESPLLTLEDVLSLKLNADWVVLSACNTAGADGKAEEALSGLARGFFFAGSRSLLVTHWSVESESAMQLTTHTFAAYEKDPTIRRAEALRQAMLSTMKIPAYNHPAYWAPYALVGEGGR
jgi:CHAT domain-containing protein